MGVFLEMRRWTTLGVIAAEVASDITRLLAFLMPLKVILLAASDGVPRYFPFIDPAHKMPWIVGLSIGAFIAYGLTLSLESIAERFSEGASTDVLEGGNEMAVSSNQHAEAQRAYSNFCRVYASVLFVIVGGAVIGVLKLELFAFVATAIMVQYSVTDLSHRQWTPQ